MDATERERKLKSFKALLRSVVQSNPRGVPVHDLPREYRNIIYEELPVRSFNVRSVEELLRLCSDTVHLHRDPTTGSYVVRPVVDASTAHLQELINKQKKPKKKGKKGGFQPRAPYRPPGGGFRKPPSQSFNSPRPGYGGPPRSVVSRPSYPRPGPPQGASGRLGTYHQPAHGPPFSHVRPATTAQSWPSPATAASSPASATFGNPVTMTSPDSATLEEHFMAFIPEKHNNGIFLPRLLKLYGQTHGRDLPADIALNRARKMSRIRVESHQSNHILYFAASQASPAPQTRPPTTAPAVNGAAKYAQAAASPGASASTRFASATTAGLAVTATHNVPQSLPATDSLIEDPVNEKNYKNMLMTYVVKKFGSGQQHAPVYDHWQEEDGSFTASVCVAGKTYYGEGRAAKKADFAAAREALNDLQKAAPASVAVPRSIPASQINISQVTAEFSRAAIASRTGSDTSTSSTEATVGEEDQLPSPGPSTPRRPPKGRTSPRPPSDSVWNDVCQKKGYVDVHITSVQGPYCIYGTLYENRGNCMELEKALQRYGADRECLDLVPLQSKKENDVCLVHNEDGRAFRAVIEYLDVERSEVLVRYLDHGDITTVDFDDLYELPDDVWWLEYQAFKMVLHNVTAEGDDIQSLNDDLEDIILDKDLVADVLYRMDFKDERLWVDLWDTSSKNEDVHINEQLRKRYKGTQELNLKLPEVGSSLPVQVTHFVVGAHHTTIAVQHAKNSSFITQLVNRMTHHFESTASRAQSLLSEEDLVAGKKCCTRWTDDKWYRCVIKSVLPSKDACEVFLMDYGYTSTVKRMNLRQLYDGKVESGDIIHLPAQCKECYLDGLVNQFTLTKEVEAYLEAVLVQAVDLTVVEKATENKLDLVKISFREDGVDIDLSQRLNEISEGSFSQERMAQFVAAMSRDEENERDASLPVQLVTPPLPIPLPAAAATDAAVYAPIYILQSPSLEQFAACLGTAEMVGEYNDLIDIMANDRSLLQPAARRIRWSPGDVCAIPHDDTFARARILSLSGNSAQVFLLDDGSVINADRAALRELPEKAWNCPFQAFFAQLYGVKPISGSKWSPAAVAAFSDLTAGQKAMQARFMGTLPADAAAGRRFPVHSLVLVDVSGERDVFVNQELTEQGHAQPLKN